eukprot:tig00001041_g6557.t1
MADPMECEPAYVPSTSAVASAAAALSISEGKDKLRRRKPKKSSGWSFGCVDPTRGRMHGMLHFWRRRVHSGERDARRGEDEAGDDADENNDAMEDDGAAGVSTPVGTPAPRRSLRAGTVASPARSCPSCGSTPSRGWQHGGDRSNSNADAHKQQQRVTFYVMLPYVISGYLQLLVNVGVIAAVSYLCYAFVNSVRADVDNKVVEYSAEVLNEIATCRSALLPPRMSGSRRGGAGRAGAGRGARRGHLLACYSLREPLAVARSPDLPDRQVGGDDGPTKLSAETLAEIVNGFVEPISYKTMPSRQLLSCYRFPLPFCFPARRLNLARARPCLLAVHLAPLALAPARWLAPPEASHFLAAPPPRLTPPASPPPPPPPPRQAFFTVFTFGFVALSNIAFHLARRSAAPSAALFSLAPPSSPSVRTKSIDRFLEKIS